MSNIRYINRILNFSKRKFSQIVNTNNLKTQFDVKKHLCLDKLPKIHTLESFGFCGTKGFSNFGASEPFRLLTPEAITITNEILNDDIIQRNCTYSSPIAPMVLREVCNYSSFLNDMWNSNELTSFISEISNISLKPHPMKLERSHINIQSPIFEESDKNIPIFGWHVDSQPFVCIVMLSDMPSESGGIGGETYIKTANEIIKLQFPEAGYAYVLQGSIVPHCAMPAQNYNRKTMITSFIPDDVLTYGDNTNLELSKTYSNINTLTHDYFQYRINEVSEKAKKLVDNQKDYTEFNMNDNIMNINLLIDYLEKTKDEIASI
jgi:hypothetical protein